jgi:hypothetical protein
MPTMAARSRMLNAASAPMQAGRVTPVRRQRQGRRRSARAQGCRSGRCSFDYWMNTRTSGGEAMDWMMLQTAVPGPIEFHVGAIPALLAWLAVCLPLWLPIRHWRRRRKPQRLAPRLRVVHGASEPARRAA